MTRPVAIDLPSGDKVRLDYDRLIDYFECRDAGWGWRQVDGRWLFTPPATFFFDLGNPDPFQVMPMFRNVLVDGRWRYRPAAGWQALCAT